jgi:hypothetical protein
MTSMLTSTPCARSCSATQPVWVRASMLALVPMRKGTLVVIEAGPVGPLWMSNAVGIGAV